MDNLELLDLALSKDKYNDEPVVYCPHCLSLKIMALGDISYCDECGCTETDSANIFMWEHLYFRKYGKKFLNLKKKDNGRANSY